LDNNKILSLKEIRNTLHFWHIYFRSCSGKRCIFG